MSFQGFHKDALNFLNALAGNNRKDWFNEYKNDYEDWVRTPALEFIEAMAEPLHEISPYFTAIPKKSGGSMMRPYKDTRFSKDKTPMKTNVGIQFRHQVGKDVHAPGFYLHIEPNNCFIGSGIWRPDGPSITKIRAAIVEHEDEYRDIIKARGIKGFEWSGESLVRPPKGVDKEHPLLAELKRKDLLISKHFDESLIFDKKFVNKMAKEFAKTKDLMRFLCMALEHPF